MRVMGERRWGNWKMGWVPKVACASLVLAKSGGLSAVTLRRLFYPWLLCSDAITSIVWYLMVIFYYLCACTGPVLLCFFWHFKDVSFK